MWDKVTLPGPGPLAADPASYGLPTFTPARSGVLPVIYGSSSIAAFFISDHEALSWWSKRRSRYQASR
jgi:hypothetical protein